MERFEFDLHFCTVHECIFFFYFLFGLCVVGKKEEQIRRRHNELAKRKNTSIYGFSHSVFFLQTLEVVGGKVGWLDNCFGRVGVWIGGWLGCLGGWESAVSSSRAGRDGWYWHDHGVRELDKKGG